MNINARQNLNGEETKIICHAAALEDIYLKWAMSYGETKSTGHLSRHFETYHPEVVEVHNKGEAAVKSGKLHTYLSTPV